MLYIRQQSETALQHQCHSTVAMSTYAPSPPENVEELDTDSSSGCSLGYRLEGGDDLKASSSMLRGATKEGPVGDRGEVKNRAAC